MMIDIDHVSFQYSGAEQENLQDFKLQIKKGECVVLTGESGCGKTCVTRLINTLIPHFYEGEMSGAVLIDGVDTRTIQPHDLSDKTSIVSLTEALRVRLDAMEDDETNLGAKVQSCCKLEKQDFESRWTAD